MPLMSETGGLFVVTAFSDISLYASLYHILNPPIRFFINGFIITDRNHARSRTGLVLWRFPNSVRQRQRTFGCLLSRLQYDFSSTVSRI